MRARQVCGHVDSQVKGRRARVNTAADNAEQLGNTNDSDLGENVGEHCCSEKGYTEEEEVVLIHHWQECGVKQGLTRLTGTAWKLPGKKKLLTGQLLKEPQFQWRAGAGGGRDAPRLPLQGGSSPLGAPPTP